MEHRDAAGAALAAYKNRLAKKVGTITNKIEAEQKRHAAAIKKLADQLDSVYDALGAEAAEDA